MISIQLNGEDRILDRPLTLQELLAEIKVPLQAVGIAVNSHVVPRSEFEKVKLQDQDQVEMIHAVGGG